MNQILADAKRNKFRDNQTKDIIEGGGGLRDLCNQIIVRMDEIANINSEIDQYKTKLLELCNNSIKWLDDSPNLEKEFEKYLQRKKELKEAWKPIMHNNSEEFGVLVSTKDGFDIHDYIEYPVMPANINDPMGPLIDEVD